MFIDESDFEAISYVAGSLVHRGTVLGDQGRAVGPWPPAFPGDFTFAVVGAQGQPLFLSYDAFEAARAFCRLEAWLDDEEDIVGTSFAYPDAFQVELDRYDNYLYQYRFAPVGDPKFEPASPRLPTKESLMKPLALICVFLLAFALGCGEVTPATGVLLAAPPDAGAAGGAGGAGPDAGAAGAAAPDAGAAGCAPPTLVVSWTIVDLATLAPISCAAAGVLDLRVNLLGAGAQIGAVVASAVFPCDPGTATIDLKGLPTASPPSYGYALVAEGSAFTAARAAWVRTAARFGALQACGPVTADPIQVVAGTPASCAPCEAADRCCSSPTWNDCPSPGYSSACSTKFGDERDQAISSCQSTAALCS